MKKKMALVLVLLALLVGATSFSRPASGAEFKGKTLKLAAGLPENSIFGKHFKWWATEVEKRTGGKVKVQIYWIESLVKAKDMLPALQSGFADVGGSSAFTSPTTSISYGLLDHIYNCGTDYGACMLAAIETLDNEPV